MKRQLFCSIINPKGSVITKRRIAKILGKLMTTQKFQNGRACFEKEVEDQNEIKFLTWILSGNLISKNQNSLSPIGKIEEIL